MRGSLIRGALKIPMRVCKQSGCAVWAAATPIVLGKIRVLGAAANLVKRPWLKGGPGGV